MQSNKTVLIGTPCLLVGGTELQTLRLVEALTEEGYQCVTVCYFEYDIRMVQRYEQSGSEVVCLSAYGTRPKSTKEVFHFLKRGLRRVVREYHPAIAHVQYMAPGALPIIILKQLGIKTILATVHTDATIYKNLRLVRMLERHVTTVFTCVSETAERGFFGSSNLYNSDLPLRKHNHFTIPNCMAKHITPHLHVRHTGPASIGMVARLERIKGVDLALPAFVEVLKQHPDSTLSIIGDGSLHKEMEAQQQKLGIITQNVIWIGSVEHGQLEKYYQQMDIVWVPSRSEGFGLTAVEAMAQGCVVVAAATGGLKELVNDGKEGLLFQPEDSKELANKTIQLLNNDELLNAMSEKAFLKAEQYGFENYQKLISDLYHKLSWAD